MELTASELPAFIAALPKLRTETLTIKVSGTLTADSLVFSRFYGSGSIAVAANADGDAVFKARVLVSNCSCLVTFGNIRFQDPTPGAGAERNGLRADGGSRVVATGCAFSSTDGGSSQLHSYRALYAGPGSFIGALSTRGISGCGCAAMADQGGIITCSSEAEASNFHNNAYGAYVYEGGIITMGGTVPNTMGGAVNTGHLGGLMVVPHDIVLAKA